MVEVIVETNDLYRLSKNILQRFRLKEYKVEAQATYHLQKAITELERAATSVDKSLAEILTAYLKVLKKQKRSPQWLYAEGKSSAPLPYSFFTRLLMIKYGHLYLKHKHPQLTLSESHEEQLQEGRILIRYLLMIKHDNDRVPYYALTNENKILDSLIQLNFIKRIPNSTSQLDDIVYLTETGNQALETLSQHHEYIRILYLRARNKRLREFLSFIETFVIDSTTLINTKKPISQ